MTLPLAVTVSLAIIALAALASCLSGYVIRRLAPRLGLIDQPAARKVHITPTPLGGGIAIWIGLAVCFLIAVVLAIIDAETLAAAFGKVPLATDVLALIARHRAGVIAALPQFGGLFVLATILMLLGLADDRRGLNWRVRLAVQFVVAIIVAASGLRLTFFVDVAWLNGLVTVIWIVGLVNAFNMLDNMDGLSGGVAAIAATLFAIAMLRVPESIGGEPQWFVAGFLWMLVGSLLGFLWHNRTPARMFMGDAGSYLVGFWVAIGVILATFSSPLAAGGRYTILAPLSILAVPLYDMSSVIWIRVRSGTSPFEADKNHFSHRLAALGLSKSQAVWTIYLVTLITGVAGLLLYEVRSLVGVGLVAALIAGLLVLIAVLEHAGQKAMRRSSAADAAAAEATSRAG